MKGIENESTVQVLPVALDNRRTCNIAVIIMYSNDNGCSVYIITIQIPQY